MMTPIVNGIRGDYRRKLNFVYASLDEKSGKDLARRHGVIGYPVVLLLDGEGNKANTIRGVAPRAVLEQAIDELYAKE
jgi:thioredoxin-related protein